MEKEFIALLSHEDSIYCEFFNLVLWIISNLHLRTVGFVIGFSTFLLGCIDYPNLRHAKHTNLSDVIVPHCVSR